jgi:hypothetical protein
MRAKESAEQRLKSTQRGYLNYKGELGVGPADVGGTDPSRNPSLMNEGLQPISSKHVHAGEKRAGDSTIQGYLPYGGDGKGKKANTGK